ncbi:hypothetical protein MO867_03255 [Microbulbifer sp. OS29]|uniref:Lipoprotein n=1 Tax=Microbulbifer okhotskensis TaxID=2926617 RepID=A0A9X2ELQ2_9GAMM|nr:hypothetical protein [Microbulbifer okhotskensis]MCO1333350.1 hypothetical protein [Microbulbifer okhotskensis]
MTKLFILPFISAALLIGACAQEPSQRGQIGPVEAASQVDSQGLAPRSSGLDEVAAAFAFDMSGAKVFVAPVEIGYTKRFSSVPRNSYREKDYELDQKDLQQMNALLARTFAEKFLAPRNSVVVADQQEADYTLSLSLEKFSVAAPLEPSAWAWRVYTEQSAYGVLVGTLYDREGNPVLRFRDRRDIGENFGGPGPGGRLERFTSVTFWSDMRVDMRRAFASLNRTLL